MLSPSGIGLGFATLLSTSIECILYGISSILFSGTMWALTHGRPKKEINWSMVLVAVILMVFNTIHVVVDIERLVAGFITKADSFPGGPTDFFADVTQRTFLIKNTVYILQTLLGDGVVVYRCLVVWQRFAVIVLPAMLWCATCATSAGLLYHMSHAEDSKVGFQLDIGKWVVPFYLLTVTTNVLGSALLVYRIWKTNRNEPGTVRVLSQSGVDAALLSRFLIDATILYTFTLFTLLACYAYQSIWQLIVLDMVTPMISITFYTVLVRIAIAKNACARVPTTDALSPLRFAVPARIAPSPSEHGFAGGRRCSI